MRPAPTPVSDRRHCLGTVRCSRRQKIPAGGDSEGSPGVKTLLWSAFRAWQSHREGFNISREEAETEGTGGRSVAVAVAVPAHPGGWEDLGVVPHGHCSPFCPPWPRVSVGRLWKPPPVSGCHLVSLGRRSHPAAPWCRLPRLTASPGATWEAPQNHPGPATPTPGGQHPADTSPQPSVGARWPSLGHSAASPVARGDHGHGWRGGGGEQASPPAAWPPPAAPAQPAPGRGRRGSAAG